MKSVLRNLTLRADASLLGHVEDFQPLDNSVAVHGVNEGIASPPQDKQLAELKLLSRVEHDVAASSLLSSVTSGNDEGSRNQNVRRLDQHDGHKGNTKIAFTAVLSGGERVSTLFHNQPDSTASTNPSSTVVPSALMKKGNRLQQTSALPTLCEEEGCTEEETHTEPLLETNPNGEFTPLDDTEMDPLLGQCPTFRQMLVIDTNESEHEGESSQFSDLPSDKHPEVSDDDNDERDEADDEAFAEMLAQLPNDSSSLMLSISDFTVPRLSRVRDALAQAASPCRERRSILASDGTHVLLQEKIGAFQYRGTSGSGLALFKVNREDAATADAAARRRQRSIAYGNECKRTYLNMK
uniref:Uncharacterized protein n=1 Tax=Globisporangium ultimum (strain ATCC 200006 / CBS 805.95 / DAOM BR144) TaxID=431595 RepID=K3X6K9_GLOUD